MILSIKLFYHLYHCMIHILLFILLHRSKYFSSYQLPFIFKIKVLFQIFTMRHAFYITCQRYASLFRYPTFNIKIFISNQQSVFTGTTTGRDIYTTTHSKSILQHNTSGPPVPAMPVYATAGAGSARCRHWPPATRPSIAGNCPSHR